MPKAQKKATGEGNRYDKILKENLEAVFIPLIEAHLGIKIKKFTPLKEKMQTTVEREMDSFYDVVTETDDSFILHLEFQTTDENDMVYRKGEYHGMALRRKKKPIRHLVIYIGEEEPKMQTQLKPEEIYSGFDLINVHALNPQDTLASQVPEWILMTVFSNYAKEKTEEILKSIIERLRQLSKNKSQLSKFLKQLIVFARLRKIEDLTTKIVEKMPITYDYKTDYFYLQGKEEGIEKGLEKSQTDFVKSLLLNTDFDTVKIASLVGVAEDFVKKIQDNLQKEPNVQDSFNIEKSVPIPKPVKHRKKDTVNRK